jgi:flagellar biosynthetic protein FlhB
MFNVLQTGLLWRPQTLAPDLSRVNPATGLRRIFSIANLGRLVFAIIKIIVVAAVAVRSLSNEHETILGLAMLETPQVAIILTRTVLWIALQVAAMLFVLALLDYAFQWWRHEQGLKMTNAEVREELRNLQGDPQVAARRRMVQRQRMHDRPDVTVPKAHVVVARGSELCVAIRYDTDSMPAPLVVAKGSGPLAARIGRLALEHGIPIIEDQELAQMLDKEAAVNQAIPRRLFAPVADLLARAFQRSARQALGREPVTIR